MATQFAKNFAENWFEAQKKAIKIITDTQEKIVSHEALNEFTQENANIYQDWLSDQEKIVSDQLEAIGKNDINFFNPTNKSTNTTEFMNNMFEQWKTMQDNFMNMQKSYMDSINNNSGSNPIESFTSLYNTWQNNWVNSMKSFNPNFDNKDMLKTWEDMIGQFEAYNAFSKIMTPFLSQIKNNKFTEENFEKIFNTKAYVDFISNTMGIGTKVNEMTQKMFENFKSMTQESTSKATQFFPTIFGWQKTYFEQFNNTMKPFEMMMAPDKNKEILDSYKNIIEKSSAFTVKGAEFQQHVIEASIQAVQSATKEISDKMSNEESNITDMKEFYSIWMNHMDAKLTELYNTKEYSKLQGELSSLGFELKKLMDDSFQTMLADTPFVTNHQMDDLAKTVTSLKREIRSLKKELKEIQETKSTSASSSKSTTKAKSSSSAKSTSTTTKK